VAIRTGVSAGEVLSGTQADDQLFGLDGDDAVHGLGGNDLVDGGNGNDQLGAVTDAEPGDLGNDVYIGGPGNDRMSAGPGDDTAYGGEGNDRIFGDLAGLRSAVAGDDFIAGGAGSDSVAGGGGFDVAYFDLPLRAYAIGSATFPFPPSNRTRTDDVEVQGITLTSGSGPTAVTDYLLEIEELRFVDGRMVTNPDDVVAEVYRVFEAGLDRAPDPIGLNYWAGQVAAGAPLGAFAAAVVGSPEFQARYGDALDNTAFVQQLYRNVLARDGEPAGVDGWVSALNAGATRGDVLMGFANSSENVANTGAVIAAGVWDGDERAAQVARLYDTAFNRLPDLDGFLSNKAAMDSGVSLELLVSAFERSPEFTALYGGPEVAPRTLVEALYANTLSRGADAEGLAFWTQRIESGAATREQVIVAFSESLEHQIATLPAIEGGIVFV
jgi:Ca2+-binding RTX toxin-like protein